MKQIARLRESGYGEHELKTQLNRRHLLRGTGALIALPALDSIGFRRFASAAETKPAAPSKRSVFLGIGFGLTKEIWFPDTNLTLHSRSQRRYATSGSNCFTSTTSTQAISEAAIETLDCCPFDLDAAAQPLRIPG